MSKDTDTPGMYIHERGVLICIGHVLADVFHDESICMAIHPSVNEACEVKIRATVEIQFVTDHLGDSFGLGTLLGDDVLGEFIEAVFVGVWSQVRGLEVMGVLPTSGIRAMVQLLDELFRVNLVVLVESRRP
jgi:hypothetical protein